MRLLHITVVICLFLNIHSATSQTTIWTENFGTGCDQGQLANGFVTANGTWNITATGTNAPESNEWFISATEAGMGVGNCGDGCLSSATTNRTLHLGNVAIPAFGLTADNGASYNAGGLCGSFFCVETDKRVESPVIDLTGESNITLDFSYMEFGSGTLDNASLWYFDGTTWSQLIDLAKTATTCSPQGIWTAYSQLLPASADNNPNVQIGFRWVNNDDGAGSDPSFAVDDITLTVPTTTGPIADFSASNTTICEGDCIDFSDLSTLGTNPSWSWTFNGAATASSTAQNPTNICYNAAGTYDVELTVTDDDGNDTELKVGYITVNPLPTVVANATNTTICENDPVTLSGSGADSYSWDNGVTDGVAFNPTTTTTYTVTGTDVNGCENTDDITVTVNPLPTVTANATITTICENDPVTLTGSGADSYSWDNGVTDGVAFNPTTTTTYTVTGTDVNGCENTDDITVTVDPLPTVTANTTNTTICDGDPVTLTGSGANSYSWDNGVTDGVAFNPTTTTTYTVTGTDANGCENTDDITVTVDNCDQPIASFTTSSDTICEGENITFTDNSTGDAITDWVWTFNGGAPADANTQGAHNITFDTPGTFDITLEITDANGTDDTTIVVTVNPIVTTTVNTSICEGDSILIAGNYETTAGDYTETFSGGSSLGCDSILVTLLTVDELPDATITSTNNFCEDDSLEVFSAATNGGTWSATCGTCIDPTSAEFNPSNAGVGTHMIYYEVNNPCGNNIDSIEVTVHPTPDIDIQGGNVTIAEGEEVDLSVIVNPINSSYVWTPSEGLSCSDCEDPTASPITTTNYTVFVTTSEGCEGIASTTITVTEAETPPCNGVHIPTLFSPNEDGNNDEFCILSDCIVTMELAIYNRWGELVFNSIDSEDCWDGRHRDEIVNSGVYIYKLRATLTNNEEVVESGNITVVK